MWEGTSEIQRLIIGNEIAKRGVDALLSFPGQPELSLSREADVSAA